MSVALKSGQSDKAPGTLVLGRCAAHGPTDIPWLCLWNSRRERRSSSPYGRASGALEEQQSTCNKDIDPVRIHD